jgi:hypothetical protein
MIEAGSLPKLFDRGNQHPVVCTKPPNLSAKIFLVISCSQRACTWENNTKFVDKPVCPVPILVRNL